MGNYKGLKFENSMNSFRQWAKEFPPLDKDAVKATGYKKADNYYLELQLVDGFLNGGKFVSTNIREYDPESKNFENVSNDKEAELLNTVFKNKVESFKEKHLY